ncbi:MAG: HYR domain-containing protein [Bacteroidia bacterium]
MKRILALLVISMTTLGFVAAQCVTCGNGIADPGETAANCPQDVPHPATCNSPCAQPTPFEITTGLRLAVDFIGSTTWTTGGLPTGWVFEGAPTPTTSGALPAADAYGAKAGLIQPGCSGSCTGTNGFCIGNLANTVAVGSAGSGGKLGANFDGRANVSSNLSYAVLRGQGNPVLASPQYNVSGVESFKIQFWLAASESSCGQGNGWGSCVGNVAYLDFSSNGGTSWNQILIMNNSSTSTDMCTSNSTNTFWIQEGTWSRVCLTVFKSSTSPGNFYPAANSNTAASGMMVNNLYFTTNFRYRIRYSQSASCTSGITTTNPGRYLAIDYPVFTSGNQCIPCGISFINMCGYGADNNDDGVGSTSTLLSSTGVVGASRSPNQAERGVEIFTSQNSTFDQQNLTGTSLSTNFDLCNAEGGDKQCIDWSDNNNFYTVAYEAICDFETPNLTLAYYKGSTAQSTTMTKVTTTGKTPTIGWRYSGNRFVSCGSTSDLNPGCNGYLFRTASLPLQFIRTFYQLSVNSTGQSWSFYGPTSCSNYFNGPFFSPISKVTAPQTSPNFITCVSGTPRFTANTEFCQTNSGFSGASSFQVTGPGGFNETIPTGGTGNTPITVAGQYTITPVLPGTPSQCQNCARPTCVNVTTNDLTCSQGCPPSLLISTSSTPTSCPGASDGCVSATAGAGTAPHTYAWSSGGTGQTVCGLSAGTYTVTVTDAAGCTGTGTATVTTSPDITPPVITCPQIPTQVNAPGSCGANVNFTPTATDNCSTPTITTNFVSGSFFPVGSTMVNAIATDASGNSSSYFFSFNVIDTEVPTITCNDGGLISGPNANFDGDVSLPNDPGLCSAVFSYTNTVNDNCPGFTVVQTQGLPDGSAFPVGTTLNTFVVTDAYGNSASCSFNVEVMDAEVPVAHCQDLTLTIGGSGSLTVSAGDVDNLSTDNCAISAMSVSPSTFTCHEIGANAVVLTVTDPSGNAGTCSATVTIQDLTPPVAVCQDLTIQLDANGLAGITWRRWMAAAPTTATLSPAH